MSELQSNMPPETEVDTDWGSEYLKKREEVGIMSLKTSLQRQKKQLRDQFSLEEITIAHVKKLKKAVAGKKYRRNKLNSEHEQFNISQATKEMVMHNWIPKPLGFDEMISAEKGVLQLRQQEITSLDQEIGYLMDKTKRQSEQIGRVKVLQEVLQKGCNNTEKMLATAEKNFLEKWGQKTDWEMVKALTSEVETLKLAIHSAEMPAATNQQEDEQAAKDLTSATSEVELPGLQIGKAVISTVEIQQADMQIMKYWSITRSKAELIKPGMDLGEGLVTIDINELKSMKFQIQVMERMKPLIEVAKCVRLRQLEVLKNSSKQDLKVIHAGNQAAHWGNCLVDMLVLPNTSPPYQQKDPAKSFLIFYGFWPHQILHLQHIPEFINALNWRAGLHAMCYKARDESWRLTPLGQNIRDGNWYRTPFGLRWAELFESSPIASYMHSSAEVEQDVVQEMVEYFSRPNVRWLYQQLEAEYKALEKYSEESLK